MRKLYRNRKRTTPRALGRIVRNPCVLSGKPIIVGTRMTVEFILELLAAGMTPNNIAKEYDLPRSAVRAALVSAALDIRRADVVSPPVHRKATRRSYAPARR